MKHFTKKLALLTLLAGLCGSAWAEDTYENVYSRTQTGWSTDDLKDWNASSAVEVNSTNGLGANANLTATYVSQSFSISENAKIKYVVDWTFATATGRTGNWNWIQFGDKVRIAINSSYNMQVSTDAGATWNTTALGYYYNGTYTKKIEIIFDTQLKKVESFSFDGTDRTALVAGTLDGAFNKVSTGFFRGGSVSWTLANYLTNITVSQAKQAAADKYDYTINYIFNNVTIKTVEGSAAEGSTIEAENPITIDEVKYYIADDETTSMTLSSNGTNELNVNLRLPNTYTYTASSSLGTTIASGNVTEGESVTFSYPQYELNDGTLYEASKNNNEYRRSFTPTDNTEITIEYAATTITNVVYFSEAENIEGATATSAGNNMSIRSSNAACGFATEDITLVNLPAGAYKAVMVCYSNSSAGATTHFQFGEEAFDAVISGASNWTGFNKEFTLVSPADVKWLTSGDSKNGLDYIYIVKTGDVEFVDVAVTSAGFATYSNSEVNLDFSNVEGLKAYYVESAPYEGNLVIVEAGKVLAGTAVLLEGGEGTYQVPVCASAETPTTNMLQVADDSTVGNGESIFVLANGTKGVGFYVVKDGSSIPAGKAYLVIEKPTDGQTVKSFFSLGGDDANAINGVEAEVGTGIIYNLNGQRVAAPVKGGLYIMNGKKMLVK